MQDVEVESLLADAGYRYAPATGRYFMIDGGEGDLDYPTEEIADLLQIPMDDLIRWEELQLAAAEGGEG
jgi:hypothetical protein